MHMAATVGATVTPHDRDNNCDTDVRMALTIVMEM